MSQKDDLQQLELELINRARLDPAGEAARYGLPDLSAGTGTTITTAAKQPLAWNPYLYNAAQGHNAYLAANDLFTHTGSGGTTSNQRMVNAGYGAAGTFGSGENLALTAASRGFDPIAQAYEHHKNLFLSAGHRKNMLNPSYEEAGISVIVDPYQGVTGMITTENFGYKLSTPVFITGVNYTDTNNDDFYSVGESAAGRTVTVYSGATTLGTTTTSVSGGYNVQVAAGTAAEVVFSGGGLASAMGASLQLAGVNVKVDLTDGNTIETNVSATLTRSSVNLTLLGIDNVNATGNTLNNTLKGNKGNNVLDGQSGNDTLFGGDGNDTLAGGAGSDTINGGLGADIVRFDGVLSSYSIAYNAATSTYTVRAADGSIDTVTGVETFQFADQSVAATALPLGGGGGAGAGPTVSVSSPALSKAEGNSGTTLYTFNVTLSSAATAATTVGYTVAGSGTSAASAADFSGVLSGTVSFAAGETSKTVTVQVVGDTVVEANETFTFALSNPTAGTTLGTASVVATITNDDSAIVYNVINGNSLANTLNGTARADNISGFAANDTINGAAGNDLINGGTGNDRLTGGTGADQFTFTDAAFGRDRVADFLDGTDKLAFSLSLADSLSDFVITGNGSTLVTLTLGTNSVVLAGTSAITITDDDIRFI